MITYKYRLYPTKEQQDLLWLHANKLNNLYNNFLAEKIDAFQKDGTNIAKSEQNKKLPKLRKNDPILAQIHSQVLQQVTLRLDKAYQDFFRRVKNGGEAPGFPKFRSCNIFFAITYPQNGYQIVDSVFTTNAYGKIKFNKHKEIQGKIKQVTITCKNNKFYLCIVTNFDKNKEAIKNTSIGIDLGLKDLVVTSDGLKIKNQQDSKYFDKKIAELQKQQSTKKRGSRRHRRLRRIINRLYEKKTNKVTDFLHKASRSLARQYDTIYVEDLAVKSMSEGNWTNLNKAMRNACLGRFVSFLEYKVHNLIKVNPRNTTKMHNSCGYVNGEITLKDRIIICPCCQETYDRDGNAAKNVYCLGQTIQRLLADGCIYAVEELKNFTVVEAFAYGKSSSKV